MISTLGYHAPSSPRGSKTRFSTGVPSPFQPQSSLFVSCRRPSIPLSPGLLPLLSFPSASQPQSDITGFGCAPVTRWSPPVHQLPVEILCNIFSYCEAQSQSRFLGPKVTISHVCRRWRSVILCMPLLWTCIHVRNPVKSTVHRVSTYLRRSGTCPFSLSIISDVDLSSHQPYSVLSAWSLIRSHTPRIRSLQLELCGSVQCLVQCIAGCQFAVLDNLDIQLRSCPPAAVNELLSSLQRGPSISSFVWRGEDIPTSMSWSQLTRLEFNGVYSLETVCSILRQCRELRDLCLDTVSGDDSGSFGREIILPKLHSASFYSFVNLANLYRQLHLPALRKIYISYQLSAGLPRGWSGFGEMLLRSESKLEVLVYSDEFAEEFDLVQCLRLPALRGLKELCLRDAPITDTILLPLLSTSTDGFERAFPILESLHLSPCQSSDGLLRSLLSSTQMDQSVHLKRIEIGFDSVHDLDMDYLRSLRRDGLQITFYSTEESFHTIFPVDS